MSKIGDKLGGRYALTERIAAGGMGEVWKAQDEILGRQVAIKLLKDGLTDQEGFTERFRNEARLSAALTHGNIAQVYDFGEDGGTSYLVMEYVPGMPLSKIITDNAPINAADTAGLISQAATALNAAHRSGLIHRDVKPANMLVTADGLVKLTDFGIARAIGSAAITKTGEVMGTAQYLAPEAALGKETTPLSDVYALAVVAHEMLAGRRPFEAESPVALALAHVNQEPPPLPQHVPPPVRAVVRAALEKDPALRPQTASEFGRALRQAVVDSDRMGFDPRAVPPRLPGAAGQASHFPGHNAPAHPVTPGESGSGSHASGGQQRVAKDSGPSPKVAPHTPKPDSRPASGPQQKAPERATSGPQPATFVGSVPPTRPTNARPGDAQPGASASGPQPTSPSSGPGGLSRNAMLAIAGGVLALILLIVLVVSLSGGNTVKPAPTSLGQVHGQSLGATGWGHTEAI